MRSAQEIIHAFGLAPHPEGGWFRETWRAPAANGVRAASTAILFLLRQGERSHWHTVDADEIWIWQGGDRLAVHVASTATDLPVTDHLGPGAGDSLQAVVPCGQWQSAEPLPGACGYALVSCVVAPGFDFAGFKLAPQDWSPGA